MDFFATLLLYAKFLIGFVLLIKGADALVDGASGIARSLRISDIVIGLTIVSFGTSAPELVVNVIASFQGSSEIATGNILGSNIANILLILGVSSIIYPLRVQKNTVWKEIPLSVLAVAVLGILMNDPFFDGAESGILSRSDGWVLIAFFSVFMYYTVNMALKGEGLPIPGDEDGESDGEQRFWVLVLYTIGGLIALPIGGAWIVEGATHTARVIGVSESFIGLSVVAIGTSLPELAASAAAALKRKSDIAIGNVVGSNIFNIFWVLGLSSTIKAIPVKLERNADISMTLFASLLLFIALFFGKKHEVERRDGIFFLLIYVGYMGFLVYRG